MELDETISLKRPASVSYFLHFSDLSSSELSSPTSAMEPLRITLKKFQGLPSDNPERFLSEFESFCLLHGLTDDSPKKLAALHLHLTGPALTWYTALPDTTKATWANVDQAFKDHYVNQDPTKNPVLLVEGEIFRHLQLGPTQALEEYRALVLEKGTYIGKQDRDILSKSIDGLPQQLAFFVRAGRPTDLRQNGRSLWLQDTVTRDSYHAIYRG